MLFAISSSVFFGFSHLSTVFFNSVLGLSTCFGCNHFLYIAKSSGVFHFSDHSVLNLRLGVVHQL